MNRQKLALFILLIVLVLAVVWSYKSVPRQKTVKTLNTAVSTTVRFGNLAYPRVRRHGDQAINIMGGTRTTNTGSQDPPQIMAGHIVSIGSGQ